ncbi:MAG: SRPBCC family protein [Gemmatimonadota bacterium]|nr:SRPBCC family protein [Gemmatimonadota bacterium]
MRWMVLALGVPAALVALAVLVGYFLPSTHITSGSARYDAEPETVWAAITGVADYPRWRRDVRRVEFLPPNDGRLAWRERSGLTAIGRSASCAVEEESPPHRFVVRMLGAASAYQGTWTYEVVAEPEGTRLTITEHAEIRRPLHRAAVRYLLGYTNGVEGCLASLQALVGPGRRAALDSPAGSA